MFKANKAAQIARERRAYNITVLGLHETRWTQSGQIRLNTGEMILYLGHEEEDAHHTEGVAFMLSHEAQNALISWEAAVPRIIYASFKTKKENIKLNIIQCYAPTNDKDEETKENFYNKLQTLCDKLKEKDMTILMGDLNAKIRSDNSGYEEVMSRQGLGKMNENDEMLVDFCAFNNMIIGGSVFPHCRIHKATWVSPAEAIKADIETSTEILHDLFGKIWEQEEIPTEWKEGYLVKFPKKGDMQDCKNYRGIMLLSVPGKVLNSVILDRLKTGVDAKLRDHQAGFRKDRSCTDQIATLQIIVEQSMEWDSSLYINFVDYEKAFDSLDRDTLWRLLQHYGILHKLISLIRNSYEDMACRVIHAGQLTDSVVVKTGVRQGCLLSPFLFLLATDWIMKKTTTNRRNGIQWTPWSQLDFADDLVLLSHSHQQMQEKTELLNTVSTQLGLNINRSKTRIMKANTKNNNPITMNGEPLEETDSFTYLGSTINKNGGTEKDVKARIQKARVAFIMLRKIWRAKQIKTNTKLRIFNSNVKAFYSMDRRYGEVPRRH